jgi:hypothetical protein
MSELKLLDPLESGSATPTLARGLFLCCGWLWLRCSGIRSWFARLFRTKFFKFGLRRKVFGKVFLIFRKSGANQALVGEQKTVLRHLVQGPSRISTLVSSEPTPCASSRIGKRDVRARFLSRRSSILAKNGGPRKLGRLGFA